MDLPSEIRRAVEAGLQGLPASRLRTAAERLSKAYRDPERRQRPRVETNEDALIYTAVRMPATFAAAEAAFSAISERCPEWKPKTILDIGAGTGASSLAAFECWPAIDDAILVEPEPRMVDQGRRILSASRHPALRNARWIAGGIGSVPSGMSGDLVICSYVLNEIPDSARATFVKELWELANGLLVLVEPGTPQAFKSVLEAREKLLALGGQIVAPCPHGLHCPMASDDWCHFAARIGRTRTHRMAKSADVPFEDEKFSYIAMSRFAVDSAPARIVRRPRIHKGHVALTLCNAGGIAVQVYSRRKDRDLLHHARDARWGDPWPLSDT